MTSAFAGAQQLKQVIRDVPDFPKRGIVFKDITTLLRDPSCFSESIERLSTGWQTAGARRSGGVDVVVAVEARGFIFGGAVAQRLGVGFVPVRKPGKLPWRTHRQSYQLEYGTDALEIHRDAIRRGQRVLIVDDVLATGGTIGATVRLVRRLGGRVVAAAFLIELTFLGGRQRLRRQRCPIYSAIQY